MPPKNETTDQAPEAGGMPDAPEATGPTHDEREAALAEREAAVAEREKVAPASWPIPEQDADADDTTKVSDQWRQYKRRADGSLVLVGPGQAIPEDSDPTDNPTP